MALDLSPDPWLHHPMPTLSPQTLTRHEQTTLLAVTAGHPRDHFAFGFALGTPLLKRPAGMAGRRGAQAVLLSVQLLVVTRSRGSMALGVKRAAGQGSPSGYRRKPIRFHRDR